MSVFLEGQIANKAKLMDSNVVVFRLMPFLALLKCDAIKIKKSWSRSGGRWVLWSGWQSHAGILGAGFPTLLCPTMKHLQGTSSSIQLLLQLGVGALPLPGLLQRQKTAHGRVLWSRSASEAIPAPSLLRLQISPSLPVRRMVKQLHYNSNNNKIYNASQSARERMNN